MQISEATIRDRAIVLDGSSDHRIGPDVVLRDCAVRITCDQRHLALVRATFEGCSISISRKLHDYEFFSTRFSNCTFEGELRGLRFGRLPVDEYDEEDLDGFGSVENCSFDGAILHLTDFIDVDPASMRLPAWPSFTILHPGSRSDLLAREWPGELRIVIETFAESDPACSAIVCHAPFISEEFGVALPELRAVLRESGAFLL